MYREDQEQGDDEERETETRSRELLQALRRDGDMSRLATRPSLAELERAYELESERIAEGEASPEPVLDAKFRARMQERLRGEGPAPAPRVFVPFEAPPEAPADSGLERQRPFDLEQVARPEQRGGVWLENLVKLGDPFFYVRWITRDGASSGGLGVGADRSRVASDSRDLELEVAANRDNRSLVASDWQSRVLKWTVRYHDMMHGTYRTMPVVSLVFQAQRDVFFYLVLRWPEEGEHGWSRRADPPATDLDPRQVLYYVAHYYAPSENAMLRRLKKKE